MLWPRRMPCPGTTWMPEPEEIRDHLTELNQAIAKNGIKLKVLPGMEIALRSKYL